MVSMEFSDVMEYNDMPLTSPSALTGSLGAVLNLWSGVTFVTLVEVIDLLYSLCTVTWDRQKNNSHHAQNQDQQQTVNLHMSDLWQNILFLLGISFYFPGIASHQQGGGGGCGGGSVPFIIILILIIQFRLWISRRIGPFKLNPTRRPSAQRNMLSRNRVPVAFLSLLLNSCQGSLFKCCNAVIVSTLSRQPGWTFALSVQHKGKDLANKYHRILMTMDFPSLEHSGLYLFDHS